MEKLVGQIDGLSRRQCNDLHALAEFPIARSELLTKDLARAMLTISAEIKREVAVFIDRSGQVLMVSVGQADKAPVFELKKRRWQFGYAGVRCIHTHPGGTAHFSEADCSALKNLRYDCMLALAQQGESIRVAVAMLEPKEGGLTEANIVAAQDLPWQIFAKMPLLAQLYAYESELVRGQTQATGSEKERAILILQPSQREQDDVALIREELEELTDTAGLEVAEVVVQTMRGTQHRIGEGKLEEIAMLVQNVAADVVIFDQPLTPSYNQMLSDRLGVKVIDKTVLILDIFAQRARSREGKYQVELAQLNYLLPRLTGMGTALSRLGGGVGTRGPGETKLETDRRHIRRRIHHITKELENVKNNRQLQRSARMKKQGLQAALVGYTNAGKSTLLNRLTDDNIYAADQLFATLDPTTRRLELDSGEAILVSDTVGFIRDLPSQLLDAFKATLEELQYADVLLHVVDVAKDGIDERIRVVEDILMSLGLQEKTHILVCNKIDLCEDAPVFSSALAYQYKCYLSCETGEGVDELLGILKNLAQASDVVLDMVLPYDGQQGQKLAQIHQYGKLLSEEYNETGAHLRVQLPLAEAKKYFREFLPPELENETKW